MKKLLLIVLLVLFPSLAFCWTATVTFDVSPDPTHRTVVLVSETSGDYSEPYGQISEPGAGTVAIGNVKPSTEYFFVAYRLTDTNEKSANSNEVAYTTPVNIPPTVHGLPPIAVNGVTLNIKIMVE